MLNCTLNCTVNKCKYTLFGGVVVVSKLFTSGLYWTPGNAVCTIQHCSEPVSTDKKSNHMVEVVVWWCGGVVVWWCGGGVVVV